jgi:hypothetical protein
MAMHLDMRLTFSLASALSLGGGLGESARADITLLLQTLAHDGRRIVLPASTLKGKVRTEAERLLRAAGVLVCNPPAPAEMCPTWWLDKPQAPLGRLCDSCRLFGSPWHPGPLAFSDATWPESPELALRGQDGAVRPGVGRSRLRRTAAEQLLFFTETTPPGLETVLGEATISGKIGQRKDAALLWATANALFAFGRGRSRGQGWLRDDQAVVTCISVDGKEYSYEQFREDLATWLGA